MDPRQYSFIPGQFPGYGYVGSPPGAPTTGNFSTPSAFPPVYQNPAPTPWPPSTPNGPSYPTTAHHYPQGYAMNLPQPFTMPGQFPLSPNFNTVPISQQHFPVNGMNPYQRMAMAEQFAKSVKDAAAAAASSDITEPSSAPETLNPDVYSSTQQSSSKGPAAASTPGPQNITAKQPLSSSRKASVNIPKNHSHLSGGTGGTYSFADQNRYKRLEDVQNIIQYEFHDPDILEEALESPDSGVTCVSNSYRDLGHIGNKRLAAVGTRAMELVLMSECYYARTKEGITLDLITSAISDDVLSKIANTIELEKFIHGRRVGLTSPSNKKVPELPMPSVIRAVKAVVGAVFVDGGCSNLESVKAVMNHLGLRIKKSR